MTPVGSFPGGSQVTEVCFLRVQNPATTRLKLK
jgi:hypothetical protein